MYRFILIYLFTITVLIISACSSASNSGPDVSGTISYEGDAALPENTIVTVQIQDTSLADAPAKVISEQIIDDPDGFPIDYEVFYNADQIEENHVYSMSVRITDDIGKLYFINDTNIPVITRGNPTEDVEIAVISVGD